MRLITLFPRRVGLSIGGGRYTHSHIPPSALYNIHRNKTWTRCSFASITTSANDTQDPAPASSQDIDLDEYMKSAAETIASRKPRISIDNMSTTPSYLLNLALADHLPASCQPDLFAARHSKHGAYGMLPTSLTDSRPPPLPEGHHLVYFPLQVSSNGLMADGTDKDHYPGWPFVRRMWAGGSVNFISHQNRQLYLDNNLAFCIETLGKPVLKRGVVPGEEMVFIDVKRRYFKVTLLREIVELRRAHGGKGEFDETEALRSLEGMRSLVSSIAETRKLVFMRERATTPSRSPEPVAETLMQGKNLLASPFIALANQKTHTQPSRPLSITINIKIPKVSKQATRLQLRDNARSDPSIPLQCPHLQRPRHTPRQRIRQKCRRLQRPTSPRPVDLAPHALCPAITVQDDWRPLSWTHQRQRQCHDEGIPSQQVR